MGQAMVHDRALQAYRIAKAAQVSCQGNNLQNRRCEVAKTVPMCRDFLRSAIWHITPELSGGDSRPT